MYKLSKDLRVGMYKYPAYTSYDGVLTITNDTIKVKKGFTWDGMTCWREGKLTDKLDANGNKLPISWRASCVHDALYTYLALDKNFPLTRKVCDNVLRDLLYRCNAFNKYEIVIIYTGVRLFGRFMQWI